MFPEDGLGFPPVPGFPVTGFPVPPVPPPVVPVPPVVDPPEPPELPEPPVPPEVEVLEVVLSSSFTLSQYTHIVIFIKSEFQTELKFRNKNGL